MSIYLVKEEDTIDKIAGLYDVSVEEIAVSVSFGGWRSTSDSGWCVSWSKNDGVGKWLCLSVYQSMGIAPDTSLYERTARIFLWFYGGGRIDSTGAIR